MSKKFKAMAAGLAFVAGCEIGIALQLMKMIRDYTIKENALHESAEISDSPQDGCVNDAVAADDDAEKAADRDACDPAADPVPESL